jgi:hypothetical protein
VKSEGFKSLERKDTEIMKKTAVSGDYLNKQKADYNICYNRLFVVMDGIEPPTQGFSVLCSTN